MIGFCICVFANSYPQEQASVFLQKDILGMKAEGIAFLESGMNEDDAKTIAINDAKRNALEQAGTYLESHTAILNYKLVKDEIITFSAGLLKVKVLSEERTTINNIFTFKVKILAGIDTKLLNNRIAEIQNDSGLKQQLEEQREKIKQLETKITNLQASGSTASKQTVQKVLSELSAIDWFNKGLSSKDPILAIDYYTKVIQLDLQFLEAYSNRGFIYWAMGNKDAAIRDFNKVIELNPQNIPAFINRGSVYLDQGNSDAALRDYNKAIELNPNFFGTYTNRGNLYLSQGNYDAAIRDLNKAIELNPKEATAYYNRGISYIGLENLVAAIRDFNKAIELNPQYSKAYSNRGVTYMRLDNYELAIRDFNKAILLDPQDALNYYNRAVVNKNLTNKKTANDDYNTYLRITGSKGAMADEVRQSIRDLGYTPEY